MTHFGDGSGERKQSLLAQLERAVLPNAVAVQRLHEALCYLRALPDDAELLTLVDRMLDGFAKRRDLRRHRRELADTGIAGTETTFPFYAPTARRLAESCGASLSVDWASFRKTTTLLERLPLMTTWAESPALDELDMPVRDWIATLKGEDETDAQFVVRAHARIGRDEFERNALYDELGLRLRLRPGPGTPSRTHERAPRRVVFQTTPLRRERPDVAREIATPPKSIRSVEGAEARVLVALAQDAMVSRQRDLDAFMHADVRDVRVVDCGDGLEFVCIGVRPERRLLLESVYAFLTLRNGVPVGYVLTSALLGSSEIAYNVFDNWRGGDAGWIYGRVLAMTHALFRSDTFTVYPYQLGGDGNLEGLRSGAWWFYQKLGFRSRDPEVLAGMRRELARIARDPGHRTDRATLRRLASSNVFWQPGRERPDVIGAFPLEQVGLVVAERMAQRFGSDRERGERVCAAEAAKVCGVRSRKGWSPGEQLAWRRFAPLVTCLPGLARWSAAQRRALVTVIRAKGGRRESDFVRAFDAHRPLRRALSSLGK